MAVQIYLVHLHASHQQDDAVRGALADLTVEVGGFVLMATNGGSLIVALDEQWISMFQNHRAVEFCGAVSIDPNGAAASKLREMFAVNVAAQLAGRQNRPAPAAPPGIPGNDSAPRYRPMRWHLALDPRGAAATGVTIGTHHQAKGVT